MKKSITLLLCVLLLIGIIPVQGVFSAGADENVALGKPVTALSSRDGFNPNDITDGDINNFWGGTAGVDANWLMIDLGEAYVLSSVILHLRIDVDVDYYRENINIEFSNTPDFSVKEYVVAIGKTDSPFGKPVEVVAPSKTPYRYVRAIKTNTVSFYVNELEVYGSLPDTGLNVGEDVEGTELEGPVTILSYLGMMGLKYPDESLFGVDGILTRAQAVEAVVDAFASTDFSGGVPFGDVDPEHENYADIVTACHLGYITGDTNSNFRPDDYVTKTEFLFMTLRAIGYDDVVQKMFNNSTAKVISLAGKLDLLRKVSSDDYQEPVTRGEAAMIFYNALLAPCFNMSALENGYLVFDEDTDYLEQKHGIILRQGVVEENRVSTLDGDVKAGKNDAKIGGVEFSDPDGALDAYLGQSVIVGSHKDNPEIVLVAWLTDKNSEIVLPANDLVTTEDDIKNNTIVALDDDDRERDYDLAEKFDVIINNVAPLYPYWSPADLLITNGQLRLLDNDDDGEYEVVFVEEYTLHYLKGGFYDDVELTFIDSVSGSPVTLQRDTLAITSAGGGAASPRKVSANTVIKLFGNGDGEHCRIDLYDEPITGTLTSVSDEEAEIAGASYPLSAAYINAVKSYDPVPGEQVSAFVDEAGEILWIERDSSNEASWKIAFSQKYDIGEGLDGAIRFRLFTQDGEWVEYEIADKLTVDGDYIKKADFKTMLNNTPAGRFMLEMLRFKLDNSGLICDIDTLETTSAEASSTSSFKEGASFEQALYTSSSNAFWLDQEQQTLAKSSSHVFIVPRVTYDASVEKPVYEYTTSSAYDDSYKVRTVSEIAPNNQYTYDLQAYGPNDEDGYPACFRQHRDLTASSGAVNAVDSMNSPFMLVEKVSAALTQDGETVVKVSGRTITKSGLGQESSFMAESGFKMIESGLLYQEQSACLDADNMVNANAVLSLDASVRSRYISNVEEIGFGDVVRYQELSATVGAVERVYDASKEPQMGTEPDGLAWYAVGGSEYAYIAYYRYQIGTITDFTSNAFTITTLAGKTETYQKSSFSSIVVCDKNAAKPKIVDKKNIDEYAGSNAKVMLYSYNGMPKSIIVYP